MVKLPPGIQTMPSGPLDEDDAGPACAVVAAAATQNNRRHHRLKIISRSIIHTCERQTKPDRVEEDHRGLAMLLGRGRMGSRCCYM